MASESAPKTLQQAIIFFSDYENCRQAVMEIRWPNGTVQCPTCGSEKVTYLANARVWKCYAKHPKAKFSLKVGTIFEDSPVGLEKWLPALWLVVNCKNGISSYELARALGVTQKTAWFMLHRLRAVLHGEPGQPFSGQVEADETFIGGKARFMHRHKAKRLGMQRGTNPRIGKIAVFGLLERHTERGHSKIRTSVVPDVKRRSVLMEVKKNVVAGSTLYTDALKSYEMTPKWGPMDHFAHKVIDHGTAYVDGQIHTNGIENFWALLKRSIKGTYVSVEPFHLFRYLDEQCYRFNARKGTDATRFIDALKGILAKRLTYTALTGNDLPETC